MIFFIFPESHYLIMFKIVTSQKRGLKSNILQKYYLSNCLIYYHEALNIGFILIESDRMNLTILPTAN